MCQGGLVLCWDKMEEWSVSGASVFKEALEKCRKDFKNIHQDFLPWKSLTSIIQYYPMWKTANRYVQQKHLKATEAESALKQVYMPNYNKPNPNQIKVNNIKVGVVKSTGAARAVTSLNLNSGILGVPLTFIIVYAHLIGHIGRNTVT